MRKPTLNYEIRLDFVVEASESLTLDEVVQAVKLSWNSYKEERNVVLSRKYNQESKAYLVTENPTAKVRNVAIQIAES